MKKHILIDGGNLLHRAFHVFVSPALESVAPQLCSDTGYPTGLIYGPLSFLADWLPSLGRFDAVHLFMDGRPARRRAMDQTYKVRDEPRTSLSDMDTKPFELPDGRTASGEIDVLLHVMELLGVSVYADPAEEADDLIASFIRKRQDDVHVIVSSDKDFFQLLVNPRVAIYRPGSSGPRLLDAEGAEAYWATLNKGKHPAIPPEHVRMFKSLCGDSSDCIHGVPRLRKKVAAAVCKYGDLDKIASAGWPGFSAMERQHAGDMLDRLKLNWELVGLVDTLPAEPLRRVQPDADAAAQILNSLNIRLDTAFLVPGKIRMAVADVPAKVISLDDVL